MREKERRKEQEKYNSTINYYEFKCALVHFIGLYGHVDRVRHIDRVTREHD